MRHQYRFDCGLSVRNELYGLQGFELPAADAILNLQSDTSPVSDVRLAWGDRLSVAFGPVSLYYSSYFNPLDFDRFMFMQALDLQIYRLPGIPVVRDFALKLGVVRADVSGAGAGEDYYHFGDYLEMRYYPTEWLFLQLRGGFLTFDNRDGLYYDDRRADVRDRAAYNAAVAFMYDGLVISVYYFWNFEKVNERDDDFLRVWVTYAF